MNHALSPHAPAPPSGPLVVFAECARARLIRIFAELEAMDAQDSAPFAHLVDGELRALAADAYFLGFLGTHRLVRELRRSLRARPCGSCRLLRLSGAIVPSVSLSRIMRQLDRDLAELDACGGDR